MTVNRRNILNDINSRDQFLQGMVLLDQEFPGVSAQDVQNFLTSNVPQMSIRGLNQQLSTYDLYVLWHVVAMSIPHEVGNAAHNGPIFLPWHRLYMIRLEQELQRVLDDVNFGLPYWDWAADGELPNSSQLDSDIWATENLGQARGDVTDGILGSIQVRLYNDFQNSIISIDPRPINRQSAIDLRRLPNKSEVDDAMQASEYDVPAWNSNVDSHRNILEGWLNGPALHNRVHVWVGGDMSPGSSPNDPVFFLNHCNVDRIWEAWMMNNARNYRPVAGEGPQGHRIDDFMVAILGESLRPIDVLDPTQWYQYDDLDVAN